MIIGVEDTVSNKLLAGNFDPELTDCEADECDTLVPAVSSGNADTLYENRNERTRVLRWC